MTLEAELTEHAPFLRALARRLVADASVADDLVQETCVAALANRSRQPGRLIPWLATVLRIRSARWIRGDRRRRAREQVVASDPCSTDASTVAERLEVARRLLQHVEALEARSREVVYLRFYQDRKPRQIAAELQIPLATVKTRLARALARLRERLDADDPRGQRSWLPALCAIGGMPSGAAGTTLRWFATRRAFTATMAALTAVVVVGGSFFDLPAPAAQSPIAAGVPLSTAGGATAVPVTRQASEVATTTSLVRGLVEDAGIDAAPGAGTPAAGVVVRYRLRQPSANLGASGAAHPDTDPGRLTAAPAVERTSEGETTTDAEGRFRIELTELATLESAEVLGNELVGRAKWSALRHAGPRPENLVLTRRIRGALAGVVVDPSGVGVAQANVRLARWVDQERVAVEAATDTNGRFAFARVEPDSWLEAELEGHVQVGATEPREGRRGGWEHARIILAPCGTLAIDVVDAAGRPAANADGVAVTVAPAEVGLAGQTRFEGPFRRVAKLIGGSARLVVPAGLQLQVWTGDTAFDGERHGRAVTNQPGEAAPPIVVAAGGQRALRLVLGADVELRGVVVDPDGKPVADAAVRLLRILGERLESAALAKADARGRFVQRVAGVADRQPVLVVARGVGATVGLRAERRLHIGGAEPVGIELKLAAPQDVVGRVRDAGGRPVAARIRCRLAIPEVDSPVECAGEWRTDAAGVFRITGHVDAVHRLEIVDERHGPVIVDGVRAGDAPIDVLLDRPKAATIRLRASALVPLTDLVVRVCYAPTGDGPDWPLPGTSPWSHALPPFWPRSAVRTWPLDAPWRCEEHRRTASSDGSHDLLLDAGRAWIFVSGRDLDGAPMSLVSSGNVTIPSGETTLSVELVPTVGCRGRVQLAPGTAWFPACVAIADDAGRLLAIGVPGLEGTWSRIVTTSSNGLFAIGSIPRGTWELRVGSREELERGEARVRKRVEFAHDLAEAIVVQL